MTNQQHDDAAEPWLSPTVRSGRPSEGWLVLIAVLTLAALAYNGCQSWRERKAAEAVVAAESRARYLAAVAVNNKVLEQLPDCYTPCEMDIQEIRDLYTDGEPIFALPPDWPEKDAIAYSGKGHLVVRGGNIRSGKWRFWAGEDKKKVVLVRPFGK